MFNFFKKICNSRSKYSIEDYYKRFKKIMVVLLDKSEYLEEEIRYFSLLSKCKSTTVVKIENGEIHEKFISTRLLDSLGKGGLIGDIGKDRLLNSLKKAKRTPGREIFTDININNGEKFLNVVYYKDTDDYYLFFITKKEHELGYDNYINFNLIRDIKIINTIMCVKDRELKEHTIRVGEMSYYLSKLLGNDDEFSENIRISSLLHSIGKVKVPDNILFKDGALEEEEAEVMKLHTIYGAEILEKLSFIFSDKDMLDFTKNIIKYHHEYYDGTGYPEGLKGEKIPYEARIVAVIDYFDNIKNVFYHKKNLSDRQIMKKMKDMSGKYFDPDILDVFLKHYYEIVGIGTICENKKYDIIGNYFRLN